MDQFLQIYKCSGVDNGKFVSAWTGNTFEPMNTRAFNGELSRVNLRYTQYQLAMKSDDTEKASSLANDIDLHTVCLNALKLSVDEPNVYTLEKSGYVINGMINAGLFDSDAYTVEARQKQADLLFKEYKSRMLNNVQDMTETVFTEFWAEWIISENDNGLTQEQQERINEYMSRPRGGQAVGTIAGVEDVATLDPKQYKNTADYMIGSGVYFLYLFLDDPTAYGKTVKARYDKEVEMFEYVKRNVGGMYDEQTILNYMKQGCYKVYGMSPARKIKQLQDYGTQIKSGKMGEPVTAIIGAIVAIISVVITVITAVMQMIKDCYYIEYQQPSDYEQGVPQDDDMRLANAWNEAHAGIGTEAPKRNWLWWIVGGFGALMLFK